MAADEQLTNEPDKSYLFISYHHDDRHIAQVIRDELLSLAGKGRGKGAFHYFLDNDPACIGDGTRWEPTITKCLAIMDWLLCIYTGDQSQYCGFEVGTFSTLNKLATPTPASEKRLLCLYDIPEPKLPSLYHPYQNHQIPSTLAADADVNWFESPVGIYLRQFCAYRGLYTPSDSPTTYARDIELSAERITKAFDDNRANDEKDEKPTQLGFSIDVDPSFATTHKIADHAPVVGNTLTFDIFKLNLSQTTWGALREKIMGLSGGKNVPWMEKIEADAAKAVQDLALSGDDVTFLGNRNTVYIPILVRYKIFNNGRLVFYVLFVETLDRRFVGRQETSVLLTTLIMGSRLRFTYFEEWENTRRIFGTDTSLPVFRDSVKQLIYNLEWLDHETVDHGLTDKSVVVTAFGDQHRARIERFYDEWSDVKKTLLDVVPTSTSSITDQNRPQISNAVLQFLDATRKQNADFLELCLARYTKELTDGFRQDGLQGIGSDDRPSETDEKDQS